MINFKDLLIYAPIVGVGGSGGGGVTIKNQNKTITENGTYTADSGYTGLGRVEVNVQGGGGGASVYKVLSWKGTTVPNEGEVGTLYINNKMSVQQVLDIVTPIFEAEKHYNEESGEYENSYIYIVSDETNDNALEIYCSYDEDGNVYYVGFDGWAYNAEIDDWENFYWFEYDFYNPEEFSGWNSDVIDFSFSFNSIASPFCDGQVVGQYNSQLSSLFSITPFEVDEKETVMELSGEYDSAPIALTQKETIDVKSLLEQKKLPFEIELKFGSNILQWEDGYGFCTTTLNNTCYILQYLNEEIGYIENWYYSWVKSEIYNAIIIYGISTLPSAMFKDCTNLTNIIIPDSVTTIGNAVFENCTNLTNIIIPDSVTTIGNSAFASCSNLTNIIIPDSVTVIPQHAFVDCVKLTNITLPVSITNINYMPFGNINNLEITYLGTMAQWNSIQKDGWTTNLSNWVVHCTDGDITR